MGGANLSAEDYDNLERAAETSTRLETRHAALCEVADWIEDRLRQDQALWPAARAVHNLAVRIRDDDLR